MKRLIKKYAIISGFVIAPMFVSGQDKEVKEIDKEKKSEPEKKEAPIKKTLSEKITFNSDFRFRFEEDWDSRKTDGTFNADRGRARIRFRAGFFYNWSDNIGFGGRLRVGDIKEQQSPHYTLGSEFEPKPFVVDRAYIKGTYSKFWWSLGKDLFPFWNQSGNEIWWHNDVTPEGAAMGGKLPISKKINLKPTVGYFIVNSLGKGIEMDPSLKAGQLAIESNFKKFSVTAASGYFTFNNIPNQPDSKGTYSLDYSLINSGIQVNLKTKIPVAIGFDYMTNLKDYSADTNLNQVYRNQTQGYIASLNVGQLKKKNDFLIGYYYAYVPKLAVVDYFSQDDWLRWGYGNSSGTRASNLKGHEIRLGYAFGQNLNLIVRTYLIEGIVTTGAFTETNNRIRFDLNIGF